jgi:transposase
VPTHPGGSFLSLFLSLFGARLSSICRSILDPDPPGWDFWECTYLSAARTFFTRWFWRATHSRLKPMAQVAWLIRRHLSNVVTYHRHRLTNAGLEPVNATIQWVKKTARGFRNAEHFKTAIYFHCGGLDLYPLETR